MIKKLYDFRQVSVPAPLLQAEVTRQDLDAELALTAARFTCITAVSGPVENGDVVGLEYVDEKGLHRIYANVGKGFDEVETLLPGFSVGDKVPLRTAEAGIVSVKRPVVPALTDGHVQQLGIENVADIAALENHLFEKLAELQRKRKFGGIRNIVFKAVMENTEFEDLEQNPWYQALHQVMMDSVAALADRHGKTVEETIPLAMRMEGKPLEECREAMKQMNLERVRQAALGQAYAAEMGREISREGTIPDIIGRCVDALHGIVFEHFAPQIVVERK